ncbi:MAG: glycoside hydrolase family 140 protein [Bacteroidetes bacterium]|nr:glycoside hydrolase family 140 protein [Bacteroidota bacterium]
MKKSLTLLLISIFSIFSLFSQPTKVSSNGRYLINEDGTPFFYLGDTAWELFHRLNREETDLYLTNRAEKGFTVIQAVVLAQLGGLEVPNAYGHIPLKKNDPTKPNEDYFKHVDYIVDKAASLGLTIGMLPTWGSYWSENNPNDVIFNEDNAHTFGEYLGKRYKEKPIIWILGGDHNIHTEGERKVVEAMARGLEKGDTSKHLITFHPRGPGLSSDYFHDAVWLDFNMFQSSHGAHDHDNGLYAENDYKLTPTKPTLDGEPRYERILTGFYFSGFNRLDRFDDYDARQAAYWSILAGSCGHTYGHNSIWQMYTTEKDPVIGAIIPWNEAINHPGSFQMKHVRTLFEARSFAKMKPSQKIIKDGPMTGGGKIRAGLAEDGSFAVIYSPQGESFSIDKSYIKGKRIKEIWYDPRYGVSHLIHTGDTQGIQTYTPPTSGRGQDWILILEDEALGLELPGYH